jgi:flagellar biosynthesis/type III secretory pathway protein FliH
MLVEVSEQVIGVICLDATPDGVAAIHLQVNPDKLERITRQWTAAGPHRPLPGGW